MADETLHRRRHDPATSSHGVAKVPALRDLVLRSAELLGTFSDTTLTLQAQALAGNTRQIQRNVVARTRLNLERDGLITRRDIESHHQPELIFDIGGPT